MILSIQTDEGCLAVPPARETPASMDDLVAMCRAMGVGTGLLRACQRRAAARPVVPEELGMESCRVLLDV